MAITNHTVIFPLLCRSARQGVRRPAIRLSSIMKLSATSKGCRERKSCFIKTVTALRLSFMSPRCRTVWGITGVWNNSRVWNHQLMENIKAAFDLERKSLVLGQILTISRLSSVLTANPTIQYVGMHLRSVSILLIRSTSWSFFFLKHGFHWVNRLLIVCQRMMHWLSVKLLRCLSSSIPTSTVPTGWVRKMALQQANKQQSFRTKHYPVTSFPLGIQRIYL